jgi:hypothetical protein
MGIPCLSLRVRTVKRKSARLRFLTSDEFREASALQNLRFLFLHRKFPAFGQAGCVRFFEDDSLRGDWQPCYGFYDREGRFRPFVQSCSVKFQ